MQSPPILRVEAVSKHFGGLKAVDDISLELDRGVVHTIIGPNGAGKTTLFNVIAGALPPSAGRIFLEGKDVTGWRPHEAARHGVGRTFQNIRLFKKLTVLENVLVARVKDSTTSILSSLLPIPRTSVQEQEFVEDALKQLEIVGLAHHHATIAMSLPYGQQRLLEIARVLALHPKALLLDEPGAGLNHGEKAELIGLLSRLRSMGHSILLIEHNMQLVMGVSDCITVLDHGKKLAFGTPTEISKNPEVVRAYLGSEFSDVAT